jgi:hypothetical protein
VKQNITSKHTSITDNFFSIMHLPIDFVFS